MLIMNNKIILAIYFAFLILSAASQEKENFKIFPTDDNIIFDICLFDNGEKLAVADSADIKIFSVNNQILLDELTHGHSKRILAIDISNDNSILVSGGRDSTIIVWNLRDNTFKQSISLPAVVTSVDVSPDSRFLLAGVSNGCVFVYDLKNDGIKFKINDHKKDVTSVIFSPDGKLMASASGDKTINLYSTENGNLVATLKGHKNWVRDISFYEDGHKLISCGDDSSVIYWDLSNLKNITSEKSNYMFLRWITNVDYKDDDEVFVIADITGRVEIISMLNRYKINLKNPVNKILFVPNNGKLLEVAVATHGGGVVLINAANMKFAKK